jgi:hypothetical protein
LGLNVPSGNPGLKKRDKCVAAKYCFCKKQKVFDYFQTENDLKSIKETLAAKPGLPDGMYIFVPKIAA